MVDVAHMSVRRRMLRERVEREALRARQHADMTASLGRLLRVVTEAQAEGLTTLTPDEFAARLAALV